MEADSKKNVKKFFLGFIQLCWKDAESLVNDILRQLEKDKMKLQDCHSWYWNNTTLMAGHIGSVHQRLCERNNPAVFVNMPTSRIQGW